jgi:hypothetical protein
VHALGAHGPAAIFWEAGEAEVAEHAPAVELVHALTGEWGAAAVGARAVGLGEGSDAAAHEHCGKVGHGSLFGRRRKIPLDPCEYRALEMGTPVWPETKKARY